MLPNSIWNSVHHLQHSNGSWLSETGEAFSHLPMLDTAPGKEHLAQIPLDIRPEGEVLQHELLSISDSQAWQGYCRQLCALRKQAGLCGCTLQPHFVQQHKGQKEDVRAKLAQC